MKALAVAALCLMPSLAVADGVKIELNGVETRDAACRMVFTAQSPMGVDKLVLETALFDSSGGVSLLTLFDFKDLPEGSLRVKQFDIPGRPCESLSRVLFNGVDSCEGPGCAEGLAATSRVDGLELL